MGKKLFIFVIVLLLTLTLVAVLFSCKPSEEAEGRMEQRATETKMKELKDSYSEFHMDGYRYNSIEWGYIGHGFYYIVYYDTTTLVMYTYTYSSGGGVIL